MWVRGEFAPTHVLISVLRSHLDLDKLLSKGNASYLDTSLLKDFDVTDLSSHGLVLFAVSLYTLL